MKISTKRLIAASLATAMTASMCALFTGCDNGDNTDASSTPVMTLPTDSNNTSSTTDTSASDTSATQTTTSASDQGGTVTPTPSGDYTNPLTGEPCEDDLSNQKPIAIVVDNISNAYANQTGLDQADVLYETLVAPGITRFLMVVSDYTKLDSVCNIRSGRDYHLNLAAQHNAVLVCHGGHDGAQYDFYELAAERLGSRWGYVDTMFESWFSHSDKGAEFGTIGTNNRSDLNVDTIFKPDALTALLRSNSAKFISEGNGTLKGASKDCLEFVPYGTKKDMSGASTATNIDILFTCDGATGAKAVAYKYDAATDKYLRSQDGYKHTDSETGKQLAFTNVITLLTEVEAVESGVSNDKTMTLVDTTAKDGDGYYFYGGKVINIKWTSYGEDLVLTDPNGDILELATGNTYIGYVDSSIVSGGAFWN